MYSGRNTGLTDPGTSNIQGTLQLFNGKWKGAILYHLLRCEILRFSELVKLLSKISHRTLVKQLREMELKGLVARVVHAVVPPRVDYSLTPLGRSLEPVINAIGRWGQENLMAVERAALRPRRCPIGSAAIKRSTA